MADLNPETCSQAFCDYLFLVNSCLCCFWRTTEILHSQRVSADSLSETTQTLRTWILHSLSAGSRVSLADRRYPGRAFDPVFGATCRTLNCRQRAATTMSFMELFIVVSPYFTTAIMVASIQAVGKSLKRRFGWGYDPDKHPIHHFECQTPKVTWCQHWR